MKQESLELLGGFIYGVAEGLTKTVVPTSKGFLHNVDDSIKNFSGTINVGRCAGEAFAKVLRWLIIL